MSERDDEELAYQIELILLDWLTSIEEYKRKLDKIYSVIDLGSVSDGYNNTLNSHITDIISDTEDIEGLMF